MKLVANQILGTVMLLTLAGTTVGVSTGGIYKVLQQNGNSKPSVPEVKTIEEIKGENKSTATIKTQKPVTTQTTGNTNTPPQNTSVNNTANNSSNTNNSNNTESTSCIITLFGKQYDVTSLRNTHPGGDVFNCGSDETAKYQAQHGNDVSRMQRYLVSSGGSGNTTTNNNQNNQSSTSSQTNTSNRCIITVSGSQYDVTPLQRSHPGGNIFNCGTDMTVAFNSQYGGNLSMIAQYKVGSSGSSGTGSGTGSGSGEYEYEDEYEDEDREHEDEEEWESEKDEMEDDWEDAKREYERQRELEQEDEHEQED